MSKKINELYYAFNDSEGSHIVWYNSECDKQYHVSLCGIQYEGPEEEVIKQKVTCPRCRLLLAVGT